MAKEEKKTVYKNVHAGSGAFYGIGLLGALVYFIEQANNFPQALLGIVKAILWPAFVVYKLLFFLGI